MLLGFSRNNRSNNKWYHGETDASFFSFTMSELFSPLLHVSLWSHGLQRYGETRINFFVCKKLFQVRFGNETLPVFGPSSIESIGYLDLVVKLSLDLGAELGGSVGFVQVLNEVRVDDQPRLLVLAWVVGLGADGLVGQAGVLGVHAALGLAGLEERKKSNVRATKATIAGLFPTDFFSQIC